MNRFRKVIEQSLLELKQPEVAGEFCVHSLVASATCRSCVDACPRQAWILDDSVLGLDTSACDGCGLCVPACSEGAIQRLYNPVQYHWKERDIVFLACERAGLSGTEGVVPCVHGIGVRDLLILYHKGVKDLMLSRGDCSNCQRGEISRLDDALKGMNRMLHDRELPPLRHYELTAEKWTDGLKAVMPPAKGPEMERRYFLRRTVAMLVNDQSLEERLGVDKATWSTPVGQILPATRHDAIAPFIPRFNLAVCHGCDACVRLCPHQAISLERHGEGSGASYIINPDSCSGCGLCIDGCEVDAISVETWAVPSQLEINLIQTNCPACGADNHRPEASEQHEKGLCRICSQVNHYSNLHQVLE